MRIATLNPSVTGANAGDTSPFRGGKAHWFAMTRRGAAGRRGRRPLRGRGTRIATFNPSAPACALGHLPFQGRQSALVRNDTKGGGGPPRASAPTGSRFTVPSSLFPLPSSLFSLHSSLFTFHSSLEQKRPAPVYEAERPFYAFVRPSPKLTARALSTALMALSSRWPIRSRRRDLSRVRICSSRITLSRFRPTLGPER